MKRSVITNWLKPFVIGIFLVSALASCKREPLVYLTSEQVNITGYIEKYPDNFSEWKKILDLTGNSGFLRAYGNYTHFLPTNEAVKAFLKERGKTSAADIDLTELKAIVKFHLLEDTISSQKFTDGKLPILTMYGQYLVTGVANVNGVSKVTINRQANLVQGNIVVGNGIIHVIDHVLTPAKLTLAQMIEADAKYSIFTQALKETGLYDTLNIVALSNPDPKKRFLTVFAESDDILKASGIADYAALKAKYSNTANPKDFVNGLHQFMDYHILFDAKYLADIVSAQSHTTLATPEIITAKLVGSTVLINDVVFNSVYEPGFVLDRANSDYSAANGVLHATAPFTNPVGAPATTGHYEIKVRVPFPVYWDVADFPEIRKQPAYFRKATAPSGAFLKASATSSPIAGWDWQKTNTGPVYTIGTGYVYGDYLVMNIGVSNRNEWVEMRTPLIVRGKYHVWACYRRQLQSGSWPTGTRTQCRTLVDGDVLPKPFDFAEPIPSGSVAERESLGWKSYTSPNNDNWISKDVGIIDIKSTDVHTLRLEPIIGSQPTNNLDMFHFIPVSNPSQILPRFRQDGSQDFTPLP